MHHLVMPRLAARAQLRRHVMKLRFWTRGEARVADLDCMQNPNEEFFVVTVTDDFGLADGFHVVFYEEPLPEPDGILCVLSVMRMDEPFSNAAIEILRNREVVSRERLRGWAVSRDS